MDLQEVTSHRVPASGRTFVRVTISSTQEAFFQVSQYVVRSEHLGSAAAQLRCYPQVDVQALWRPV